MACANIGEGFYIDPPSRWTCNRAGHTENAQSGEFKSKGQRHAFLRGAETSPPLGGGFHLLGDRLVARGCARGFSTRAEHRAFDDSDERESGRRDRRGILVVVVSPHRRIDLAAADFPVLDDLHLPAQRTQPRDHPAVRDDRSAAGSAGTIGELGEQGRAAQGAVGVRADGPAVVAEHPDHRLLGRGRGAGFLQLADELVGLLLRLCAGLRRNRWLSPRATVGTH